MEAKTAGFIANAKNWTFSDNEIKTADGSKVTVTDLPEPHGKDVPYANLSRLPGPAFPFLRCMVFST